MNMKKEIVKWSLFTIVTLWGITSLILMMNEGVQFYGLASWLICTLAGRLLYKKGYLPE